MNLEKGKPEYLAVSQGEICEFASTPSEAEFSICIANRSSSKEKSIFFSLSGPARVRITKISAIKTKELK